MARIAVKGAGTSLADTFGADALADLLLATGQGCVETIEANLMIEPGIGVAAGDAKAKSVHVAYSSKVTSPERIETAIARLGYRVE